MIDKKNILMGKAIKQAQVALKHGEVPIGALIVDKNGTILARAYNKAEHVGCQTAHAEVIAIERACKKIDDWRLNGCWIYVTLEPCLMCIGLIQLSRFEGVVFGARSPLFGCGLHNEKLPSYVKELTVVGGVRAQECSALLRSFFKSVRQKKEKGRS